MASAGPAAGGPGGGGGGPGGGGAGGASKKSYLSSGTGVNLALLRDLVRRDLLDSLASCGRGRKALVIDKALIGIVGLVAEFSALKERGVERMYPLPFDGGKLPHDCPSTVVYLTRPRPQLMPEIAGHIKHDVERDYNLFFVPRKTILCERALEHEGVLANFQHIGAWARLAARGGWRHARPLCPAGRLFGKLASLSCLRFSPGPCLPLGPSVTVQARWEMAGRSPSPRSAPPTLHLRRIPTARCADGL